MAEKVEIDKKTIIDIEVKSELNKQNKKYINNYYRSEGLIIFNIIGMILSYFVWETNMDGFYFFLFAFWVNLIFAVWMMFKHLKTKGVV